jgi:hypothetical protein
MDLYRRPEDQELYPRPEDEDHQYRRPEDKYPLYLEEQKDDLQHHVKQLYGGEEQSYGQYGGEEQYGGEKGWGSAGQAHDAHHKHHIREHGNYAASRVDQSTGRPGNDYGYEDLSYGSGKPPKAHSHLSPYKYGIKEPVESTPVLEPEEPSCPQTCDLTAWPLCQCLTPATYSDDGRGNCNVGAIKTDLQVRAILGRGPPV